MGYKVGRIQIVWWITSYRDPLPLGRNRNKMGLKKYKAIRKPLDQVEGKKGGMATDPKVGSVWCFICQGPH